MCIRDSAREACSSFGADWSVKKEGPGALICTKGSTTVGSNCDSVDTWRLVVWKYGSADPFDPANEGQYSTYAGYFYGGHKPCTNGDNLGEGYPWTDEQRSIGRILNGNVAVPHDHLVSI